VIVRALGHATQARECFEQALAIATAVYGPRHAQAELACPNLASC